ncbi:related to Cytochrome c oxidase assembly protein 1 [Zygosaccharomyces bailii]|uniref:ZYBA0S16-00320g1_1 n=1 Tax=Zygosaccharomyces bailii (strain CLIB 213 / ATCC 58445 / CBS 680 / BCRC 21525 / NBRC 1098 / NCYC 1416 / NRRL Y-2227) TaxID=1333698 RepID=A0A8J2XEM1_ZYGB2|nr:ZYBA0S16-00320g1_1 [Zygosaccharomyces bailii CLIB 213]CDH11190.1 related to Cytochrome oxidase assembly protein 1 [Zygosaccharomyces bailii ISA1307]SJM86647.1 related to Cytochrome c oxidase assembly protein 1 [Zygosaccharomyces bailii]
MLRTFASKPLCKVFRLPATRLLATQGPELVLRNKNRPLRIDRDLPDPFADRTKQRVTFAAFGIGIIAALALIFNYEKTESPVISNTFYHLRRSPRTQELLGENIEFDGLFPWIHGKLNQVAGKVNIRFNVKGSKNVGGVVRLIADKDNDLGEFLIREWSLTVGDNQVDLLQEGDFKALG